MFVHNSIILEIHINIPPQSKLGKFCPVALGLYFLPGVYKVNFHIFPPFFQAESQKGREAFTVIIGVKLYYYIAFGVIQIITTMHSDHTDHFRRENTRQIVLFTYLLALGYGLRADLIKNHVCCWWLPPCPFPSTHTHNT